MKTGQLLSEVTTHLHVPYSGQPVATAQGSQDHDSDTSSRDSKRRFPKRHRQKYTGCEHHGSGK